MVSMLVKDVNYQDEYITVKDSMTVIELSKEIAKAGIPDAVVIDDNEKVVGAIDTYDIISKCLAVEKDPNSTLAKEIMFAPPPVKLMTPLKEVHEIMQKLEATVIPVIDDSQALLGVVTIMDVIDGLGESQRKRGFLGKIFG